MKVRERILQRIINEKATELLIYLEENINNEEILNVIDKMKLEDFLELDIDEFVNHLINNNININYKPLRKLINLNIWE